MKTLIGKEVLAKDLKHGNLVGARYIDNGRRVRLTTGEFAGEVLSFGSYEVLEHISNISPEEILKTTWKI